MAIAFVKDTTSTTDTITVPAGGFAAGNLVVIGGAWDDLSTVASVSDSVGGNTWAQAEINQGNSHTCNLWYSVLTNALGAAATITVNLAGNDGIWIAAEFSGIATSPLDQHTGTADTNTLSHTSGTTGATTQADEVCVGLHFNVGSQDFTATGGYTQNEQLTAFTVFRLAMQYLIVSATGTQASTCTTGGNASANNLVATFKASGAAPPAPTDTETRRYQIRHSRMVGW